uniref:Uncharacterized protein n=1 Tax=Romanomermis culicivorax TaxID=13658 RepID=A0A915HU42_ROMCU
MISASEDDEENTFCHKMLESGQKSATQYWLTEGKTWPSFQKIALRWENEKKDDVDGIFPDR